MDILLFYNQCLLKELLALFHITIIEKLAPYFLFFLWFLEILVGKVVRLCILNLPLWCLQEFYQNQKISLCWKDWFCFKFDLAPKFLLFCFHLF